MSNFTVKAANTSTAVQVDVVIVGAGFAGLYMLHKMRQLGLSARVFEAGGDVGGAWYWNRYPGCRCDIESQLYSYSFSEELTLEWEWSERFPTQPEILRYLNHVADRFELRADMEFNTRIIAAHYCDVDKVWKLRSAAGAEIVARFCIMATGCLSAARIPDIPGMEDFEGEQYHTAKWPHDPVSFKNKRVAVIGTGSTGIQLIPNVAADAAHCYVFQRTPSFSLPARNAPLTNDFAQSFRQQHIELRERARAGELWGSGDLTAAVRGESLLPTPGETLSREQRYRDFEARWQLGGTFLASRFSDTMTSREVNDSACDFVRKKIREIVVDPALAALLSPQGYPIAAKRVCLDTNYYATFNRKNVSLIDAISAPIEAITPTGLCTRAADYAVDMIVYATGFDAMTGALLSMDIRGRQAQSLCDHWRHGPQTYLGLMAADFPNLFFITGPGSPSVLSNMAVSIEQHVEWISGCIQFAGQKGCNVIEAELAAQEAWVEHVNSMSETTLFPLASSWYSGANVPGKPRIFMPYVGGVGVYRNICNEVAASGYRGLAMSTALPVSAPSLC